MKELSFPLRMRFYRLNNQPAKSTPTVTTTKSTTWGRIGVGYRSGSDALSWKKGPAGLEGWAPGLLGSISHVSLHGYGGCFNQSRFATISYTISKSIVPRRSRTRLLVQDILDKIRNECCNCHASNKYADVPAERIVNCPDIFIVFVEVIDHGSILSVARAMWLDRRVLELQNEPLLK